MSHTIFRTLILTLLVTASVALGACTNTIDGAGQDIERAGEKVQESTRR